MRVLFFWGWTTCELFFANYWFATLIMIDMREG